MKDFPGVFGGQGYYIIKEYNILVEGGGSKKASKGFYRLQSRNAY
jgi:hypothetical protein